MTRRIINSSEIAPEILELLAELEAIPQQQIEPIRLDIMDATGKGQAVSEKVKLFRDRIAEELGEGFAIHVDRLPKAALACSATHALHLTKVQGANAEKLIVDMLQTRRVLSAEAQILVAKKKLSATTLAELVGGNGYKAACLDVLQLVAALRANWAAIESATPVTRAELEAAESLAHKVSAMLSDSELSTASPETADLRQRAYTFFIRTYDEVRRAMTFMRWEENDVDDFAPSLFAGRTRKRDDEEEVIEPVAPVLDGANGTPTNGTPIPPGMPGAPPFTE